MEVEDALETFKKHDLKESKKVQKSEKYDLNDPKKVQKSEKPKHGNHKGFKSSDIVSPIYGVQSNRNMVKQKNSTKVKKSDIISKAYNEKEFEMEKTQNIEFLNSLKEFRKNL